MLVCTAVFMLLLDITIVSVALPSIQRDLRASLPDLQWVSAAYALVLAVLLLPAATLGDRLGRRRLFLAGLVIFTAGSLACALAPTALALQLFRALQGVGGAVLFATGTPLLRAEFSGAALARALGVFGATLGAASAIGPLAGGVLTDTLGWRSIFFINLPIGVAAPSDIGTASGVNEARIGSLTPLAVPLSLRGRVRVGLRRTSRGCRSRRNPLGLAGPPGAIPVSGKRPLPDTTAQRGGAWRHAGHSVGKQCRETTSLLSHASSDGVRCTTLAAGYHNHRWKD